MVIPCAAAGRGYLLFGDQDGSVHTVSQSLEVQTFQAYEFNVTHLWQMKQHNILITVGVSDQLAQCSEHTNMM